MLLEANVRKMLVDGSQWASWAGYHIPVSDKYVVIWTPAGTQMNWRPGTWVSQRHQLTYFWPEEWFTIHVGYNSNDGTFSSGYCDVVLPSSDYTNTASELIYTDLYIEIIRGARLARRAGATLDGSVRVASSLSAENRF